MDKRIKIEYDDLSLRYSTVYRCIWEKEVPLIPMFVQYLFRSPVLTSMLDGKVIALGVNAIKDHNAGGRFADVPNLDCLIN